MMSLNSHRLLYSVICPDDDIHEAGFHEKHPIGRVALKERKASLASVSMAIGITQNLSVFPIFSLSLSPLSLSLLLPSLPFPPPSPGAATGF